MVIFHNYGLDLETVQRLYEKQKHSPPSVRNAAARDGQHHVGAPADAAHRGADAQVPANKNLMTTKESKKIVKTYNKLARTHRRVRDLWHLAWSKSIEQAKAGLQATLIIRHPQTASCTSTSTARSCS